MIRFIGNTSSQQLILAMEYVFIKKQSSPYHNNVFSDFFCLINTENSYRFIKL